MYEFQVTAEIPMRNFFLTPFTQISLPMVQYHEAQAGEDYVGLIHVLEHRVRRQSSRARCNLILEMVEFVLANKNGLYLRVVGSITIG